MSNKLHISRELVLCKSSMHYMVTSMVLLRGKFLSLLLQVTMYGQDEQQIQEAPIKKIPKHL